MSSQCAQGCSDFFFTALSSCVPMIFAMIGAMNRMRFSSDAPQQKILGCVTDTFGAASLGAALLTFERACYSSMSREVFGEPVQGQVRMFEGRSDEGCDAREERSDGAA